MIDPASRRPGGFRPLSEINVTPLVDVMLVLLIVFMVTAPLMAAGLKVDLPTTAAKPLPPTDPVEVSIGRDGDVALGTTVVGRDGLIAALRAHPGVAGHEPPPTLRIRGDRAATYGDVLAVVDLLSQAGFGRIALVSRPVHTTAGGPP